MQGRSSLANLCCSLQKFRFLVPCRQCHAASLPMSVNRLPQELTPGRPQQSWVQSQTTFAALGKGEDGDYEVRVLKQKIWVDGISYELQVRPA